MLSARNVIVAEVAVLFDFNALMKYKKCIGAHKHLS